jgi:hypothetical protein
MKLASTLMMLSCLASGCTSKEQAAPDRLKVAVAATLKDPGSAQFSNLRLDGTILCGEVNGRNSFGAYTGADKFTATDSFVHLRNDFVERDFALQGTPANDVWKNGTAGFDKFWSDCQSAGVPVS